MSDTQDRLGKDSGLKRYGSLSEMIGDAENPTPIVALRRLAPEGVELFVKLEWMNPFGSVKDRAAKWMLAGLAERSALDGRTVLEPTSGNTGIALAGLCALKGRPMRAVVPASLRETGNHVTSEPTQCRLAIGRHAPGVSRCPVDAG